METNRGLWPLLVILLLTLAVAVLFWLPDSAKAPSEDIADEDSSASTASETKTNTSGSPASAPATNAGKRFFENNSFVTIIEYTEKGFNPSPVTINTTEEVRFVNKSGGTMKIGTDETKSSMQYVGYKQPNTVGYNGTFQILVPVPGLWTYHDLNAKPPVVGVINVK